MKPLRVLAITSLALLIACSGASGPVDTSGDLRTVLSRWQARELTQYRFDFDRHCFCIRSAVEPVTIVVRHGTIEAVRSRITGEELPLSESAPWYTIEELFRLIQDAERAGTSPLVVSYDPLGYPSLIELGSLANDGGVRYTVTNVTPIE